MRVDCVPTVPVAALDPRGDFGEASQSLGMRNRADCAATGSTERLGPFGPSLLAEIGFAFAVANVDDIRLWRAALHGGWCAPGSVLASACPTALVGLWTSCSRPSSAARTDNFFR